MAIVGGLRHRLLFDSVYNMINDSLTGLGWFDAGREHGAIRFIADPIDPDQEVPYNTLALSSEPGISFDIELGSNYANHNTIFYLDFYAESNSLGLHVAMDLRDVIEGRMPSIGRNAPIVRIYDYRTQPASPQIGYAEIDDVTVDKVNNFTKPWQKDWWSLAWNVQDTYGDEYD